MIEAVKELKGDWIVIGGSLLPLLDIESRVTVDIDIAPLKKNDQQLEILKIAEKLGLPIEVINTAAGFYLYMHPHIIENSILFTESKNCRIYRPSFNLYLQLKLRRCTESDIEDCVNYAKYCFKNDHVSWVDSIKFTNKHLDSKKERIEPLLRLLKKYSQN